MINLEKERLRCEGFLGGLLAEPLSLPEARIVSPEDMEQELREMIGDALRGDSFWKSMERWAGARLAGALSPRILGIYTQRIWSEHKSTVLLSGDTLERIAASWSVPEGDLLRWVLSHELFHAAQLHPDFPLREEMRSRARRALEGEGTADLVAAMTWIEGSADFVMDQPGLLPAYIISDLRDKMQRRREKTSVWMRLLRMKHDQYRKGRELCAAAFAVGGPATLALPIRNPEALPSEEEVNNPELWAQRITEISCK